jgi:hypothetical protein
VEMRFTPVCGPGVSTGMSTGAVPLEGAVCCSAVRAVGSVTVGGCKSSCGASPQDATELPRATARPLWNRE